MAKKDNANPIIYSHSSSANQRLDSTAQSEWWRDTAIHSSAASSSTNGGLSFSLKDDAIDDDNDDDEEMSPSGSQTVAGKMVTENGFPARLDEDKIDSQEVYDLIRSITDPEHPLTLEQLAVVNASHITIDHGDEATHKLPSVLLEFTPTIPHCSMATLIGLSLRVRLLRSLPARFKVDIRVRPGTHQSENAVNKQLNDKERVAAALENAHLLDVVQGCLASAARRGKTEEDVRREMEDGTDLAAGGQSVWKTVEEVATRMGLEV